MTSPVSGSKVSAVAETVALPPVNNATDLPWNNAGTVWTWTLQGFIPALHGRKTEKKPLIGRPPCTCFSSPEIVTNVCCEAVTKPDKVAVPVVGSTDANCVTLGAMVRGGGPWSRLNVKFAGDTG